VGDDNKGTGAKKKNLKASKKSKGKKKAETKSRAKKKEKGSAKAKGKVRAKARVVISDADDDELEPEMEEQNSTSSDGAITLTSRTEQRRTFFRNTRYKGSFQVAPANDDGLPYFDDGWDGVVADDNDEGGEFAEDLRLRTFFLSACTWETSDALCIDGIQWVNSSWKAFGIIT
jgi:hypothetical protein